MEHNSSEADKKRQGLGGSEIKKEQHNERPLFFESDQQSFELCDEDMIEFFNRVEASRESMGSMQFQLEELKGTSGISKVPSQQCLEDEPINAKAECILVGGDTSTEDITERISKSKQEKKVKSEWEIEFAWDQEVTRANEIVFNNRGFRPNQLEVINAAKSNRDVLGIIGSGLSLTFQITAITEEGITFVVIPSVNLAINQMNPLTLIGIGATFIPDIEALSKIKDDLLLKKSLIKLVYILPELVPEPAFITFLKELQHKNLLARFVVYDADCISKYGCRFKADYLILDVLKKKFPTIPILALSFVANTLIQQEICRNLSLNQPVVIQGLSVNGNAFLEVRQKAQIDDLTNNIAAFIKSSHIKNSGIIYCLSIKECEQIAKLLKNNHKLPCASYYEGMNDRDKKSIQQQWMTEKISIITTVLPIDFIKKNTEYIIYTFMPSSMDRYTYDCHQIGKDRAAHSLIYYDTGDKRLQEYFLMQYKISKDMMRQKQKELYRMMEYCEEKILCRKQVQCAYFSIKENIATQKCEDGCDNCKSKGSGVVQLFQKEAITMVEVVKDVVKRNKKITMVQLIDYLHGANKTKMQAIESESMEKWFGQLSSLSISQLRLIAIRLLINNVIREDLYQNKQGIIAYLELGKNVRKFELDEITIKLMVNKEVSQNNISTASNPRLYISPRTKQSNDFYSINTGNERSTRSKTEINKAKLTSTDIEDIIDRLNYVKSRLAMRHKEEAEVVKEIFCAEMIEEIGNVIPKNLCELRFLVETRKWSARDEDVFVKYGNYFIQEIESYVKIYVDSEAGKATISKRSQRDSKYSIRDYEMPEEITPKNARDKKSQKKENESSKTTVARSRKYMHAEFL